MVSLDTSPRSEASLDPIRVLIADDEPALRSALTDLLGQEDHIALVGTAGDADEAIALAEDLRPHVALVDVKMPGGGGPRAAREIIRTSPRTKVIALSAFEDRPTVLEMLRAGAVGYLVKGTAAQEIVGSISRVVRGGASISNEVIHGIVDELASQLRRAEVEREARENRRGEIERFVSGDGMSMVFQPIVDLRTRTMVGIEALARFRSLPVRPPDQWFAEAVALELGVQLELSAIRNALTALPRLPESVYLSVNCSPQAAMSPDMLTTLAPNGARVVIELTEHDQVEDYGALAATLSKLRAHGTRVAIDDAGAGFASLRHTLQISPDILKADISLTRDVDTDRAKRALTSALVSFAEEMGMSIVAEGIETASELQTLLDLGVPYGQGFYLAKPGPLP